MKMDICNAMPSDIETILALQEASLLENMSAEEARVHGFLRTRLSRENIGYLIDKNWLFVGKLEDQVISYIMGGDWAFFQQWEIFEVMCSRLSGKEVGGLSLSLLNTYQYGPVCISREHRGVGVFRRLLFSLFRQFSRDYRVAITFINSENTRSLAAHRREGMEVIDQFKIDDATFHTLAFDNRKLS
ncbi:hypothetical protein C4K14_1442 [Pseudomonas chlororaphis subsp. aureofaciens]|uniref:GNAT family N-acetyltransferase n=1 Tax=Pseudomonas chlororaphis TaxID=587753 RepID=UPI000F56FC71|nr:hypothetical protein [Pseudomonas chlororaphis]AZD84283.1 hypothetical protein C4K14_1442 [Pseudomonas chlororaphis subsp. aureofaciens]